MGFAIAARRRLQQGRWRSAPRTGAAILPATAKTAQRDFIVCGYQAKNGEEALEPDLPDVCPFAVDGERSCELRLLRQRPRKTGPRFPLWVLRCGAHCRAFTLYPPGFAPWQRQSVERLSPEGSPTIGEKSDPVRLDFGGTIFDAALDAARGHSWPRATGTCPTPDRWWNTQRRQLAFATAIVGVSPHIEEHRRELMVRTLAVDTLVLRDAAQLQTASPGYRSRGCAVVDVLRVLARRASRFVRLLWCGHLIGRWGRALRWDPVRRTLERPSFPTLGTGPP